MKRILTRVLLGIVFSALFLIGSTQIALTKIGNDYGVVIPSEETVLQRVSISAYVSNQILHSKDSEMNPLKGMEKFYRPEVQAALESGVTRKIRRNDHDEALISMLLDFYNTDIEMFNKGKKKEEMRELCTRETVTKILDRREKTGRLYIFACFLFSLILFAGWFFLYDPALLRFKRYKNGLLYENLKKEYKELELKNSDLFYEKKEQENKASSFEIQFKDCKAMLTITSKKYEDLIKNLAATEKAKREAAEIAKQKQLREEEEKKLMKKEAEEQASRLLDD